MKQRIHWHRFKKHWIWELICIEIDVFKIKSGEVVVFHDQTVDRLANATGRIEEYDIFYIKQMVLDGNHSIPLFQDVVKLLDDKVRLNVELKEGGYLR